MTRILAPVGTASLEALLSRLDPEPGGTCQVPGCLHLHLSPHAGQGAPALAA